jgi:hypothetical protein
MKTSFEAGKAAAIADGKAYGARLVERDREKAAAWSSGKTGDDVNRDNAAAWPGNRQGSPW